MLAKSPIDILVTSAVKSKISFLGPVTQSSAEDPLSSEIQFSFWYKLMKGLREVTLIVRSSLHNTIYAWTVANFCVLCAVLCTWHAPCEPFMVGKLQWGQLAAKLHSHVWQIHVEIQKIQGGGRVCSWHGPCKVSMAWGVDSTRSRNLHSHVWVLHTPLKANQGWAWDKTNYLFGKIWL